MLNDIAVAIYSSSTTHVGFGQCIQQYSVLLAVIGLINVGAVTNPHSKMLSNYHGTVGDKMLPPHRDINLWNRKFLQRTGMVIVKYSQEFLSTHSFLVHPFQQPGLFDQEFSPRMWVASHTVQPRLFGSRRRHHLYPRHIVVHDPNQAVCRRVRKRIELIKQCPQLPLPGLPELRHQLGHSFFQVKPRGVEGDVVGRKIEERNCTVYRRGAGTGKTNVEQNGSVCCRWLAN